MNRINSRRNKHFGARVAFWQEMSFALLAIFLCSIIALGGHFVVALIGLTLISCAMNIPRARVCAVTLSVPEILMDVLDAFKLETPELFGANGFAQDFSSQTAVLGDVITAKIAKLPVSATYDNTPGAGFYNGAQNVTTLIEDVPVTLDQFKHVPIRVGWLTQLASKLPLYREAIRNIGYTLGKLVVDAALAKVVAANFSHSRQIAYNNITLDSFDGTIRNDLNALKVEGRGRFAIINSTAAAALGADDRVRSSLFYGALNADNGYRLWRNIAGFSWVREYPDYPTAENGWGFAADKRAICVATRRADFSNAAAQLGIPQVMEFYPMQDAESGISLTGVGWQEAGTGDVYVSAAVLFGVSGGKQGGAADTITDAAGVRLITA